MRSTYRGGLWYDKGEYDKAIADFTEAIRLELEYAVDYVYRGRACVSKKSYDKAHRATSMRPSVWIPRSLRRTRPAPGSGQLAPMLSIAMAREPSNRQRSSAS